MVFQYIMAFQAFTTQKLGFVKYLLNLVKYHGFVILMGDIMAMQYNIIEGSGVYNSASPAAQKVAGELIGSNNNLLGNPVAAVIKGSDGSQSGIEFVGIKEKGSQNAVKVSYKVVNGEAIPLEKPINVEFIKRNDGQNIFQAIWTNITKGEGNPDTGKVTKDSASLLDSESNKIPQAVTETGLNLKAPQMPAVAQESNLQR